MNRHITCPVAHSRTHVSAALLGTLLLLLGWAPGALAAEEPVNGKQSGTSFSAEVGVGVEYDSNVSVEEIDRTSDEGDHAIVLDAGLEIKQELSDSTRLSVTYDFSQSQYDEFSQVDRQTHILGANLAADFKPVDPGLSLYYIHSRLDGDKFLELYRVSPSLSGFLAKKWFARGAYVYSDKSIENREDRDAQTHAGEADIYYFRRGLRSYFNVGYRIEDENAAADELDYLSNSLKLRYIHRLELFSRMAKLELAWRYENRDYSSVTESIDEERSDKRHRWRADFEIPVLGDGAMQIYYGYAAYDSNFPTADYKQKIIGTRFLYRW